MADIIGQHEISDNQGGTVAYSGTATTTFANVPSVAGNSISGCLIVADGGNLQASFDGGTTYHDFAEDEALSWDVKGEITQLRVKTSSGTCDYRIIINVEEY